MQFSSGKLGKTGPQESTLRDEVVGVEKDKENEEGMIQRQVLSVLLVIVSQGLSPGN